jgi:CDP-glucose 4,6-dehydratase
VIELRNPAATRPWQHVLEPLSGYLWIGACLASPSRACVPAEVASGFNFGPRTEAVRTVGELVAAFARAWPDLRIEPGPAGPHEAARLSLSIAKAERVLGWQPVWDFQHTVERTVCWYEQLSSLEACKADITAYVAAARSQNLAWAS